MSRGLAHVFSPIRVGTIEAATRIVATPHAALIGSLWGPDEAEADRNIAYWAERARHGMTWMGGISAAIENCLIPGFEPTGVGARVNGVFRLPYFQDRMHRMTDALHSYDCAVTAQLIMQGGMPHGPSAATTSYVANQVSHELTRSEIDWFIHEYAFSAKKAQDAGLDGIELHANHDDLLEWFISRSANHRTDEYGGDVAGRLRFPLEVLAAIRSEVGLNFTVGIRLNAWEHLLDGYSVTEGIEIAQILAATGQVDYLSLAIGDNWGSPSYIQTHHYPESAWSDVSEQYKAALNIPVMYGGRVATLEAAERVLSDGKADLIGMARAWIAEPELISKGRSGLSKSIRPCIGCNDCIHRFLVEGLRFACAVNPQAGYEIHGSPTRTSHPRDVLVIGGGPAGMETAALLAERGHNVELWERKSKLGGLMNTAAIAPENSAYLTYIEWQTLRLESLGVNVHCDRVGTLDEVQLRNPGELVIATGTTPRFPKLPGVDLDFVFEAREVLHDPGLVKGRVALIAMEDHMQPLSVAGVLVDRGHHVHMIYSTPGPAPLVGKYSIGAALGKLATAGAEFTYMSVVTGIEPGVIRIQNVYSDTPSTVENFDSVVIVAGGIPDSELASALSSNLSTPVHIVGDAYAPRRITFATTQARELAALLD